MALLEETKQQLRAAGYNETRIAHVEREYDRRQDQRIAIPLTRDEWNMIAEALQWHADTFEDPDGSEYDGAEFFMELQARILSAPGVH